MLHINLDLNNFMTLASLIVAIFFLKKEIDFSDRAGRLLLGFENTIGGTPCQNKKGID